MTSFFALDWPARLGELALQATLWLALGLALAALAARRPRLRKQLLGATLLGLVVLSVLALLPASAWRLADLWPQRTANDTALSREGAVQVRILEAESPTGTGAGLGWLRGLLSGTKSAAAKAPPPEETAVASPAARLAVGALVLVGFFLLRLVAGLWALGRFRRQSLPIVDSAPHALLAELLATMNVRRPPQLREHPRLGAPATLGWRRPLILLPPAWRRWSDEERRCVLAHELAHIAAGDFGLSCFAQLLRALHAYQPFAHLLARQLLNQLELLADQAAARAVGGTDAYARALCRLALRPTRPVPHPPALAFWPASLSLSWRMTMLTKRTEPHRPLGWPARLLLGGALALGLAAIAGLRGPALAQAPQAEPKAAGAQPPAKATAPAARLEPFDLRFAQPDALGVLAFRPAMLLETPSVQAHQAFIEQQFQDMVQLAFGNRLPSLRLAMIEQASGSLRGKAKTEKEMGQVNLSLDLVRLAPSHSWTKLIAKDWPDFKLASHAGKPYLKLDGMPQQMSAEFGMATPAVGLMDDRTLVMGDEARVKLILEGKQEAFKPAWSAEAWRQVEGCMAAVGMDLAEARRLIEASGDKVQIEQLAAFEPVWRQADSFLGGLLPGEPVWLRVLAAAKPGRQLTMDWRFIEALKRAFAIALPEALGPNPPQVETLPGYRQTGAAGPGTVLVASELLIEAQLPKTLAELIGPRQTELPPAEGPNPPAEFEAGIEVYEIPRAAFDKLDLAKTVGGELKEPVAIPGQEGKAFFAGSGQRELGAEQAAVLKAHLAKADGVKLQSAPRLRVAEGGLACVNYGTPGVAPPARQTLITLRLNPAKDGLISVAYSNWFDTAALADPSVVAFSPPSHQPEVRRTGAVAEGGSFLVVVPALEADGKVQLVVVTPRRAAKAAFRAAYQVLLARIDDEATEALRPYFTTLRDPAGRWHTGGLLAARQAEFPALLQRLCDQGQAEALTAVRVESAAGAAADLYVAPHRPARDGKPQDSVALGAKSQGGAEPFGIRHVEVVTMKSLDYGVQFLLQAELDDGPDGKPRRMSSATLNGPYREMQASLVRRADDQGWLLISATPLPADAVRPDSTPPLVKPGK